MATRIIRAGLEINDGKLAAICRRSGVVRLWLFGSVLREDFGAHSDIDLLYELAPDAQVGLVEIEALRADLTDLFGRKVDLAPMRFVRQTILRQALAHGQELYAA